MIIFDHSPFAMLAARGISARTVVIGSGFFIPPDQYPWPSFRTWEPADADALRQDEDRLLIRVNRLLEEQSLCPMDRLGDLYSQVDESFLTTSRELDHYPDRPAARYWGIAGNSQAGGKAPLWPEGTGKKIYAYLKPFAALPALLEYLNQLHLPTLIYMDRVDPRLRDHFSSATLRFESDRLDIAAAVTRCDLAITNATLNTTAAFLQAGKPVLAIPLMLEQGIIARRIQAQGAGLEALSAEPEMIKQGLRQLLDDSRYTQGAQRLGMKLAAVDSPRLLDEMFLRMEQLIGSELLV